MINEVFKINYSQTFSANVDDYVEGIKKTESLINLFKYVIQTSDLFQSSNQYLLEGIFTKIVESKIHGNVNLDQMERLNAVSMIIFPWINQSSFRSTMINFCCDYNKSNIYALLSLAKGVNSIMHMQDCFNFMKADTGVTFTAKNCAKVSIDMTSSANEIQKIQEQLYFVSKIFNANISIIAAGRMFVRVDQMLKNLGLSLPLTCMNNIPEWGHMTRALQTIGDLLDKYKVVCFGENHEWMDLKEFAIDIMPYLSLMGVKELYFEFFCIEYQDDLNYYFSEGKISEKLALYFKLMGQSWAEETIKIARNYGIRIIAIDSLKFRVGRLSANDVEKDKPTNFAERSKRMNPSVAKTIQENTFAHVDKNRKTAAFMGRNHLFTTYPGAPGVCNLLHCPGVVMCDIDAEFSKRNEKEKMILMAYSSSRLLRS